ncbi:hypothetical protein HPB50_008984 [Hyalomma asiaticum]|uniref:Uncharacterized protein n=1 Tax=Hyalomma asiaticum TaxID=266040 RepID=A0ACB7T682_HYAAI|nr:hypothetical protein HPB50_008984 [Hyalomma asiaticum]
MHSRPAADTRPFRIPAPRASSMAPEHDIEDSHVPQLESCDLDRDRSLLLDFSLAASSDSPGVGLPLCLGLRDRERDRESSRPSSRGLREALRMRESPFTVGLWLPSLGSLSLRLRLRLL